MESENYKIVKTALSNDGKFLYFIHSKPETIDELTADSYSISLAVPSGVTTIFDVTTSEKEAMHILKMAAEKSVSSDGLQKYILDYLSEN